MVHREGSFPTEQEYYRMEQFDTVLTALEERLGVEFKNRALLVEALTHRSYLNEHRDHPTGHNERLEFLGDAVLGLVVAEHLFAKYPEAPEGEMTTLRAALVCADALTKVGQSLDIAPALLFSRGERDSTDRRARTYQIACAVEAIIGALHRDQGIGACRLFIDMHILTRASDLQAAMDDPKSMLQTIAQSRFGVTPSYTGEEERGPDHAKHFRVAVYFGSLRVASGEGASKREAQMAAARAALQAQGTWNTSGRAERRPSQEEQP